MNYYADVKEAQWQEINEDTLEEMDELPFPANSNIPIMENTVVSDTATRKEMENLLEDAAEELGFSEKTADANYPEGDAVAEVEISEAADDIDVAGSPEVTEGMKKADTIADQEAEEVAGKSSEEAEEARKRAEHEAAEAKRKAEWEAGQQAKKESLQKEMERLENMTDEDVIAASMKRVGKDTERLTRRNMKECVSEYVQTICMEDPAFARLAMHPRKNMINCFKYINRKAREFVEQEMKDNDIRPEDVGYVYGSDVPDGLCYQWAEDYFRDPDAPEDKPEKEEEFVPKPYVGKTSHKPKKKAEKKKTASPKKVSDKKTAEGRQDAVKTNTEREKESGTGQMSLMDFLTTEEKAS